ncbi:hypothetical protein [Streptomyces hirsutus]|uniref:hypothetical protein n=1 Tax=Streptomyces hirsutus TaxID=35620 RepID=UPI0006E3AB4A|nr:hypothetical protein [Streptomyces hirsutus]
MSGTVHDGMVGLLHRSGVGPTMANPMRHGEPATTMEAGIPDPLAAAERFLDRHRDVWGEPLHKPIDDYKARLGDWEQSTLAGERTKKSLASLADSLLTTGRPLLREDGDSPRLPDRDDDGDPDYRDPFPGDRERNSAFPNGLPDSSGSSGGSSGGGGGGGWNCPRTRWC